MFREVINAFGEVEIEVSETLSNLSMNKDDGRYVETIVNQQSALVDAEDLEPAVLFAGYSVSGLVMDATAAASDVVGLLNANSNKIQISVDGSPFVTVSLPGTPGTTMDDWRTSINIALNTFGVGVTVGLQAGAGASGKNFLCITSNKASGGTVVVVPAASNDAATTLQLGADQGGLEVSGYAKRRPAPSGFFANLGNLATAPLPERLEVFATRDATSITRWTLTDSSGDAAQGKARAITFPAFLFEGTHFTPGGVFDGSLKNVQENLEKLAAAISADAGTGGLWKAEVHGLRLILIPTYGGVNSDRTAILTSDNGVVGGGYNIGGTGNLFSGTANVHSYSLGTTGTGAFQGGGADGRDGAFPKKGDYEKAFGIVDKEVDIFNLMILPRDKDQLDSHREEVWGSASVFCQQRRALLIMDPRSSWTDADTVSKEIKNLRTGLVKDHATIYWPRVKTSTNGSTKAIDPSGSIAGLMARIDSNRGVWKAPAGHRGRHPRRARRRARDVRSRRTA